MNTAAQWLEVSLAVDGEMAEAVAEVLQRFIPTGVVLESTEIAPDPLGEGKPVGPLRVSGYLPVNPDLEETRQRLEEALWYLGRIRPLPSPRFRPIQEHDWTEVWKKSYRPISIGRRLLIVPAWVDIHPRRRIPILIEPGMAFGTGTHPTTRLCLELIEAWLHPRQTVIDVGCGSGVLAIAALKLGSDMALGVDTDPLAIEAARKNAHLNKVEAQLTLGLGSVADIRAGAYSIKRAPLVVANILAPVLVNLLSTGLAELIAPGGALILSGILEEQVDSVIQAVERSGLALRQRLQSEDWVAGVVS